MLNFKECIQRISSKGFPSNSFLLLGNCPVIQDQIALQLCCHFYCKENTTSSSCLSCYDCDTIKRKTSLKVQYLKPNSSNEIVIEQIRELLNTPGHPSWVIPKAHLLNKQAENALLKRLEEPNRKQLFILSAPHYDLLSPTIVSRCFCIYVRQKDVFAKKSFSIPKSNRLKIQFIDYLIQNDLPLSDHLNLWKKNESLTFKSKLAIASQECQSKINIFSILQSLFFSNLESF
ncbi:MAG: hypothetical protein HYS16_00435 [Deltaproteobacteria bacterium]|nr:MAG: hypothetical protein HYS16_00435 [Deltaproteobacteria bacterium]